MRAGFLVVGWVLLSGLGAAAGAQTDCPKQAVDAGLESQVKQMVDARAAATSGNKSGKTALYAVQLNTGKTVAVDADLPVQTASVIKLAILYDAMNEVRAGRAKWDEKITLHPGEAVPGSGMLLFFEVLGTTLAAKNCCLPFFAKSPLRSTVVSVPRRDCAPA